jgi:hypothetical protein
MHSRYGESSFVSICGGGGGVGGCVGGWKESVRGVVYLTSLLVNHDKEESCDLLRGEVDD